MLRSLFLASLAASPALAFEVRTDSQGDVVRWDQKVEFVVSPDLADELALPGAASAMSAAAVTLAAKTPGLQVKVRVGQRPGQLGYTVGAANQNDVVLLEDWPYESSNLAATLVTLNARTNLILDADIALNGESAGFVIIDDEGKGETKGLVKYDLQNTLTHELGHALGLMHNASDATSVMFPSAAPGETCKRTLGPDDVAALSLLYGTVEAVEDPETPPVGCSSMPAPVSLLGLGALMLMGSLRRRRLAVLLVAGASALAADPVAREPDEISWGEVVEANSRWLTDGKVIVTDVEVEVQRCVKGACTERRVKLQVLGGRVGELEQVVAHQPEVKRGSQVVLTRRAGHLRLTIAR